jgi:hypothetical protein
MRRYVAVFTTILATAASAQLLPGGPTTIPETAPATGSVPGTLTTDTSRLAGAPPRAAVRGGVSTRVERGSRCAYDGGYRDPVERDGNWVCERSGSGVAAGAKARTRR